MIYIYIFSKITTGNTIYLPYLGQFSNAQRTLEVHGKHYMIIPLKVVFLAVYKIKFLDTSGHKILPDLELLDNSGPETSPALRQVQPQNAWTFRHHCNGLKVGFDKVKM